jgi:hypothetical protein
MIRKILYFLLTTNKFSHRKKSKQQQKKNIAKEFRFFLGKEKSTRELWKKENSRDGVGL